MSDHVNPETRPNDPYPHPVPGPPPYPMPEPDQPIGPDPNRPVTPQPEPAPDIDIAGPARPSPPIALRQ